MAAAHHPETVGVMKETTAWKQSNGLFAGVDQVVILLAFGWSGAHANYAVFTVQNDFAVAGQMVGHLGGQANTQVNDSTVGDVLRHARGNFIARPAWKRILFTHDSFLSLV
jgi:hypothetical protein